MCESRVRRYGARRWLAAVLWLSPLVAAAQDELTRIQTPMRAAQTRYDAARAAWEADSISRGTLPVRLTIGGMTVSADSATVPSTYLRQVTTVIQQELELARPTFGPATDTLLNGISMSIVLRQVNRAGDNSAYAWVNYDLLLLRTEVDAQSLTHSSSVKTPREARTREYARSIISRRLRSRSPAAVVAWSIAPRTTAWTLDDRTIQYRQMRLSTSPVARACLGGALSACRAALAIVPSGVDTVTLWYDAETLRARVALAAFDTLRWPNNKAQHAACVRQRQEEACRAVIARVRVDSPTGRNGRAELLRRALATGGEGAWQRLVQSRTADIDSLLVAVSGVPTDTLIAAWRADVLEGRPPSPTPAPRAWLAGGLSVLLLIGGSVRRGVRP